MSDKIKSKDLSYDSSLPPFLQRLHNQNAGRGDTDRHERQIARPKKSKDPNDDDGPTVVDESGETLSKDEVDKLTNQPEPGVEDTENVKGELDPATEPKASGALPDPKASENKVTDGTATKKRKVAKAVGKDHEDDETTEKPGEDAEKSVAKTVKKAKKKAKPVKLAFDDDEET
ncbi:hypothetical protein M409DRAFT_69870 [Zasmidium cellare ATCC 36951]|uniref:DUF4604 domain-containing protein n=1 Tax=Zasmidium cellare ATCC 36951 TaxID=1080233 RepID=A0A6A6C5V7_ZASCE|nr:uncharacterized protein M409DRAFT_69870 [Zasmidium cellare ATCC 36951]KAF2161262.1 hypothetical protein M409DRAFT_69870 [Zasmidium cellare ATCC 36951]